MADMTITWRDRLVFGWLVLNGGDDTTNIARDLGLAEEEVEDSAIRLAAAGKVRMTMINQYESAR